MNGRLFAIGCEAHRYVRRRRRRDSFFVHQIIKDGRAAPREPDPSLRLDESNSASQSTLALAVNKIPKEFICPTAFRHNVGSKHLLPISRYMSRGVDTSELPSGLLGITVERSAASLPSVVQNPRLHNNRSFGDQMSTQVNESGR